MCNFENVLCRMNRLRELEASQPVWMITCLLLVKLMIVQSEGPSQVWSLMV